MNLKKVVKIVGLAFAGYCVGVWQTAYAVKRDERTDDAAERFAGKVDELKDLMKGGTDNTVEETADDITEMMSEVSEEDDTNELPEVEFGEYDQPED